MWHGFPSHEVRYDAPIDDTPSIQAIAQATLSLGNEERCDFARSGLSFVGSASADVHVAPCPSTSAKADPTKLLMSARYGRRSRRNASSRAGCPCHIRRRGGAALRASGGALAEVVAAMDAVAPATPK